MTKRELLILIVDAIATAASLVIGIWIAPEYLEFALEIVVLLQLVAGGLIAYFVVERKIAALAAELMRLQKR